MTGKTTDPNAAAGGKAPEQPAPKGKARQVKAPGIVGEFGDTIVSKTDALQACDRLKDRVITHW